MDLSSAKAVVTGAASEMGLGFATAKRVVDAGGQAVLLDVNDEAGARSAEGLGARATYIHTDVSSEADVQAAIAAAREFMGGITLAVNCAGVIGAARALGREAPMAGDFFEKTVRINLVGSFMVAKEAANVMQHNEPNDDGERGVIISTASIAAFEGQIGQVAYSASKGGVVGMTLPIARDLSAVGVRVNTVAPGLIDTPIYGEGDASDAFKENLQKGVLFPKRLGYQAELASVVVECITNSYMNAETIRVDGGIRMPPK